MGAVDHGSRDGGVGEPKHEDGDLDPIFDYVCLGVPHAITIRIVGTKNGFAHDAF